MWYLWKGVKTVRYSSSGISLWRERERERERDRDRDRQTDRQTEREREHFHPALCSDGAGIAQSV